MKTNNLCGQCVHYPLCYEVWHVDAAHPCKHISGGNVGFFRPKGELAALKERIQDLEEALRPFALYAQALGVDEDCDLTDAVYSDGSSHLTVGAFLDALRVDQAILD